MYLFAFVIGGRVPGGHLEVHDLRFAVGESAKDCWPALRAQWWGEPDSLHIDAAGRLDHADGYDIEVVSGAADSGSDAAALRLWLVHLGGYVPGFFGEAHAEHFLVAPTAAEAKARGLALAPVWSAPHRDAVLAVDGAIDIADMLGAGFGLRLTPAAPRPFHFLAQYQPLGRK